MELEFIPPRSTGTIPALFMSLRENGSFLNSSFFAIQQSFMYRSLLSASEINRKSIFETWFAQIINPPFSGMFSAPLISVL